MGRLQQIYIKRMIDYLSKEGQKIVTAAQATKAVGNQTYNQADAFGYVVYHNGAVVKKRYANTTPRATEPHHGWAKHNIDAGTGREWLDDFISEYKDAPKTGFALMVVNAAFYSSIQEKKLNYKIISQTYSSLDNIATKFSGATVKTTL